MPSAARPGRDREPTPTASEQAPPASRSPEACPPPHRRRRRVLPLASAGRPVPRARSGSRWATSPPSRARTVAPSSPRVRTAAWSWRRADGGFPHAEFVEQLRGRLGPGIGVSLEIRHPQHDAEHHIVDGLASIPERVERFARICAGHAPKRLPYAREPWIDDDRSALRETRSRIGSFFLVRARVDHGFTSVPLGYDSEGKATDRSISRCASHSVERSV